MRKILMIGLLLAVVGCAYTQEEVKEFVRDPHYMQYQQKLNDVERLYLDDKISYPEYLKRKEQIDNQYTKEVQNREGIIHGSTE